MKKQIVCIDLKNNVLALPCLERDASEAFQFQPRPCNGERLPCDVKLRNFGSRSLSGIGNRDRRLDDISGVNFGSRHPQAAVLERGVAETMPKGIDGLPRRIDVVKDQCATLLAVVNR